VCVAFGGVASANNRRAAVRVFSGGSSEGAVSFSVAGSRVVGFRFANVCPSDSSAGTLAPEMTLRNGHFELRDEQFTISGTIRGNIATGSARDVTGDCSSAKLRWHAHRARGRASRVPGVARLGWSPNVIASAARAVIAAAGATQLVSSREILRMLNYEGYKQFPYDKDGQRNGNCTIGYGHLIHPGKCRPADYAKYRNGWSREVAFAHFASDVQRAGDCVNQTIRVPLSQDQFDALTDFVFNIGCPAFQPRINTLARLLNRGRYDQVGPQLMRWIHGEHGKVLPGLVIRRGDDARMFGGGGNLPPPTPNPPPPPPGSPDCAKDNLSNPTPAGCYRVRVQVIPSYLPSDPSNQIDHLGVGVGSATIQPGGKTVSCLNPGDAGGCITYEDVAVNTTITVSQKPGTEVGVEPSTPPDSAFYQFGGACTGTGTCTLTPSSNTVVDVYFIPATATLTLMASPADATAEMSAAGHRSGGGPIYCSNSVARDMPLPCTLLLRLNDTAQVGANGQGKETLAVKPFSDNCTPAPGQGSDFCDVMMSGDQTVTAYYQTGTVARAHHRAAVHRKPAHRKRRP
jgi:lysozyme